MNEKISPKQLLEEINKLFPVLNHITKDLDGEVWFCQNKPQKRLVSGVWNANHLPECFVLQFSPELSKTIDWGTDNWEECICSI